MVIVSVHEDYLKAFVSKAACEVETSKSSADNYNSFFSTTWYVYTHCFMVSKFLMFLRYVVMGACTPRSLSQKSLDGFLNGEGGLLACFHILNGNGAILDFIFPYKG